MSVSRTSPIIVQTQWGLGDNIFLRPFVRAAASRRDVYVSTPWPELYEDLDVWFCYPMRQMNLRTQKDNLQQTKVKWVVPPHGAKVFAPHYSSADFLQGSLVAGLERKLPLVGHPFVFDLPEFPKFESPNGKPIAMVRPVTVRKEWQNEARNPRPEYVKWVAEQLMDTHHVVSVASLAAGKEWSLDPLPPAHEAFHSGELGIRELMGLVRAADVVVGGVGWIVPAAIAAKTKAFIVLGGHGGHNAPEKITDPRMDLTHIGWAKPARFCRCNSMRHECDKEIPNLSELWEAFRTQSSISSARAA
jgi:hypothetical protein